MGFDSVLMVFNGELQVSKHQIMDFKGVLMVFLMVILWCLMELEIVIQWMMNGIYPLVSSNMAGWKILYEWSSIQRFFFKLRRTADHIQTVTEIIQ